MSSSGPPLPIIPASTEMRAADFVPPYSWEGEIDRALLSTKRGFVFQYPPFPALDRVEMDLAGERRIGGIYVHIPFCQYHCAYCYYAVSLDHRPESVQQYLGALEREIDLASRRHSPSQSITTLFFGGGTPTVLEATQLARITGALRKSFDLEHLEEFTVESDPTTITQEKVEAMRAGGVNRLSIGIQSFSTEVNFLNERRHTEEQSMASIQAARRAGIGNMNLDLICGLIGDNAQTWHFTIDRLLEVAPEHVTIYLFSLRPQTSSYQHLNGHTLPLPPCEEERIEWMLYARQRLLDQGYTQTSPNCYVRETCFEQIHQRNAWSSLPLIGFGNSAYSFVDDYVTQNVRPVQNYLSRVLTGRIPVELGTRLNARDLMIRYAILRLKLLRIDRADFAERFGFPIEDIFGARLQRLEDLGLVELNADAVIPTCDGIVYIDDVCRSLYSDDVRKRLRAVESQTAKPLLRSLV